MIYRKAPRTITPAGWLVIRISGRIAVLRSKYDMKARIPIGAGTAYCSVRSGVWEPCERFRVTLSADPIERHADLCSLLTGPLLSASTLSESTENGAYTRTAYGLKASAALPPRGRSRMYQNEPIGNQAGSFRA